MSADGVKAAYDVWAPTYDTDEPRTLRDLAAAVLRKQPFELSGRCLVELGCGTGANTVWFAELAERVIALDFSDRMLEQARRRVTSDNVCFVTHDVTEPWPVSDECADLVAASLVLEHIDDLKPVFDQARRALKRGGSLFACEFHPFQQLSGRKAEFVDPTTRTIVQVPAYRHDVSDFVNAGLGAGLCLTRVDEWRYPWDAVGAPPKLLTMHFAK